MQQKMIKTRSHVESRIFELTDMIATSSSAQTSNPPPRPPPPYPGGSQSSASTSKKKAPSRPAPPARTNKSQAPPSYEDVISGSQPSSAPPPPYTRSLAKPPYLNVQAELDEIIDLTMDSPEDGSQPVSQMRRSATSDSIGSSEEGEILFSMEDVQISHNNQDCLIVALFAGVPRVCQWGGDLSFLS